MTEPTIVMLDEFPGPERRNHSLYVEAARANPGKWIELPWKDDSKSNLVSHYHRRYPDLDARKHQGVTYIRSPKKTSK
jgi:hypothetical protein